MITIREDTTFTSGWVSLRVVPAPASARRSSHGKTPARSTSTPTATAPSSTEPSSRAIRPTSTVSAMPCRAKTLMIAESSRRHRISTAVSSNAPTAILSSCPYSCSLMIDPDP